jgi:tellurite resistance protein TerC
MDWLFYDWLTKPVWMWVSFMALVVVLLVFDLGVLHKDNREIGRARKPEAQCLLHHAGGALQRLRLVVVRRGARRRAGEGLPGAASLLPGFEAAKLYLTGFVIEKSLAMDNVFVIAMIFTYFAIPRLYQHRVLFWGILGVIVLRAVMIGLGATLVNQFGWVLYIFAAFLIYTGVMM